MVIPIKRAHNKPGVGYEAASIIVQYLLRASTGSLNPGQFGVGILKPNGYHGNDADLFWVTSPEDSTKDWWQPDYNTIVPMRSFCTNSTEVRRTRGGAIQCKCHGHPIAEELPQESDPLRYADGTVMATRVRAKDFLRKMRRTVQRIFEGSTDTQKFFGYNESDGSIVMPEGNVEVEAVQLLNKYFWSTTRQPCTTIHIDINSDHCFANGRADGYVTAWIKHSWTEPTNDFEIIPRRCCALTASSTKPGI